MEREKDVAVVMEPAQNALLTDELQHFEQPWTHGLSDDRYARGMDEDARLDPTGFSQGAQRRFGGGGLE